MFSTVIWESISTSPKAADVLAILKFINSFSYLLFILICWNMWLVDETWSSVLCLFLGIFVWLMQDNWVLLVCGIYFYITMLEERNWISLHMPSRGYPRYVTWDDFWYSKNMFIVINMALMHVIVLCHFEIMAK